MLESDWKNYYKRNGLEQDPKIMAIMNRDEEAKNAYIPCRQRKKISFALIGERHNMARGDRESATFHKIDKLHEDLRRKDKTERPPEPKFKNGQSVLQWWADWMKSVKEPPERYGKKGFKRPWWFSGEVCSFVKYGSLRYAGVKVKANLYRVY